MGYSTAIYAVDLDKLKAAVGSGDSRLIGRLLPPRKGKRKPTEGPQVMLNRKGEISLNGRTVSFEELIAELRQPTWQGTNFYYGEATGIRGHWKEPYSLMYAVMADVPAGHFPEVKIGFDPRDDENELTEEKAAAELIEGKISQPKMGYQYGYGLKKLCSVLGTLLVAIEGKGGMLKALKLDTPLSKTRTPVELPKSKEFPEIGYLTADEVEREVKRLEGMDLSYPKDELIEADRKELLRALQKAAKKKLGVVAFYH